MRIMESRPIRRATCFLLLWAVIVLAVLQWRNYPSEETPPFRTQYFGESSGGAADGYHQNSGGGWFRSAEENSIDDPGMDDEDAMQRFRHMAVRTEKSPTGGSKSDDEITAWVQQQLPNLPIAYWQRNKNKSTLQAAPTNSTPGSNDSCSRFPSVVELEFNNEYWQTLRTSNGTFQLYGAYYDVRRLSRIGPAVRILGMVDRIEPTLRTFCQFWFEGRRAPVVVRVMEYKYIWYRKWGNYRQGVYQPYLIACQIPKSWHQQVPVSVSLVERVCDVSTTNLRVLDNRLRPGEKKQEFAVCVKGLDFLYDDLSVRLVEWIELLGLLGAHRIFFYRLHVHPNVSRVLEYYEKLGRVQVTPLTLPGGQPNMAGLQHMYLSKKVNHKRQNELIPYNDCLYRNMYRYEYIALLDIDEVIMPAHAPDWSTLMRQIVLPKALAIKNETRASYNVRNVYFLDSFSSKDNTITDPGEDKGAHESEADADDVPEYMHMLRHVHRSRNFTKPNQYIKCFHNPERALTLHNHFPLACLSQGCTSFAVPTEDAQLQHYRADCVKTLKKSCDDDYKKNSVRDTTIWRYKRPLIRRAIRALRHLNFFVDNAASSSSFYPGALLSLP